MSEPWAAKPVKKVHMMPSKRSTPRSSARSAQRDSERASTLRSNVMIDFASVLVQGTFGLLLCSAGVVFLLVTRVVSPRKHAHNS